MRKINFESDIPLSRQLREILIDKFVGDKKFGEQLPPERELAKQYGIHRMVVQRTIQGLCREGYFYRRPRHGTFVSKKNSVLRIAYYELPAYSFSSIIKKFEKQHPEIKVEKTEVDPKASSIIFEQLLSSNQVDLVKLSESLFQNFFAPEKFQPLDAIAEEEQLNTVNEPWQAFRWKNSYYAVPLAFSPMVIAYNKDIFKKAGICPPSDWDWKDFLQITRRLIKKEEGKSERYAFMCPFSRNQWPIFAIQNGGQLDPKRPDFNLSSQPVKEAMSFLHDLLHRWKVAPVMRESDGSAIELFSRAKVAMIMMSYYGFPVMRRLIDFDWDILPLPSKRCQATSLLADGVAVARNTTALKPCREFLKFLLSPDVQTYIAKQHGVVPINDKYVKNIKPETPENFHLYKQIMPHAKKLALPYRISAVQSLQEEMDFYWYGLQDYAETICHIRKHSKSNRLV